MFKARKERRPAADADDGGVAAAILTGRKESEVRMTAVEKLFVNSPGHGDSVARQAETLLGKVEAPAAGTYLDVGCGLGAAARRIAQSRPLSVVGIDVDPRQIAGARQAGVLPNLEFLVMDAAELRFRGAAFDVVASSKTTHHVPNFRQALREMIRVLKPGGYLIYTDLTFPAWAARIGSRLLPWAGFPCERALDAVADQHELAESYRSRCVLRLDKIWKKPS